MMKIQIQWLGGPSLAISCGSLKVLVDPIEYTRGTILKFPGFSSSCTESSIPLPYEERGEADALLLTHDHKDHFHREALTGYSPECKAVVPPSMKGKMKGLVHSEIVGLRAGKTLEIEKEGISLTIAAHSAQHCSNPLLTPVIRGGNGYTLEWDSEENPYRMVITGDSLVTPGFLKYLKNVNPHLIIVFAGYAHAGSDWLSRLTGPLTCGKTEIHHLASEFPNSRIFPVHWGNFSHYRESYNEMDFMSRSNVRLVELGETLQIQR